MLKLANRSQRAGAFKAKHVFQACLLLVLCIWLLYQVKHSYNRNKALIGGTEETSEPMMIRQNQPVKLGRKYFDPQKSSFKTEGSEEKHESSEEASEMEDEMNGREQERPEDDEMEQGEDLIDEDDRESEENENEIEDSSLLNNGEKNAWEAREEHYKQEHFI